MGWTLTGCHFQHQGRNTDAMADGNNVAWVCPNCGHPVLFVYRGRGGNAQNPVACPCGRQFYLDPQFDRALEPNGRPSVQRALMMDII